MKLKVVVTGAMGRMGQELVRYVKDSEDCELFGAVERHDHPDLAKDVGRLLFGEANEIGLENDLRNTMVGANVIIDFTFPEASMWHLKVAAENEIPIVIGSTGFTGEQLSEMEQLAQKTRVVFSPNMAVGVNLLWRIAQQAATILGDDFDAEIVEVHHRRKVDAPSGTAVRLGETIAKAWEKELADIADHGRVGQVGEREFGRIGIHAVRGGDIVGDHKLSFFGDGEEFYVGHRATSRINFVKGAFRAAMFLQSADKGLYNMFDVLKI